MPENLRAGECFNRRTGDSGFPFPAPGASVVVSSYRLVEMVWLPRGFAVNPERVLGTMSLVLNYRSLHDNSH
jgi:hypothetical protein